MGRSRILQGEFGRAISFSGSPLPAWPREAAEPNIGNSGLSGSLWRTSARSEIQTAVNGKIPGHPVRHPDTPLGGAFRTGETACPTKTGQGSKAAIRKQQAKALAPPGAEPRDDLFMHQRVYPPTRPTAGIDLVRAEFVPRVRGRSDAARATISWGNTSRRRRETARSADKGTDDRQLVNYPCPGGQGGLNHWNRAQGNAKSPSRKRANVMGSQRAFCIRRG